MAKKRKFKLKKKFRRMILYIILLTFAVMFGINRYELYKYHQTYEYKLLEVGYDEKTVNTFLDELDTKQVENLINQEKIDYAVDIIGEKYFLKKNFEKYIDYYEKNSKYSFTDVVAIVNVGATKEWYSETKTSDTSKGVLILSNKFNLLPEDYDAGEIKKFGVAYAYGSVSANIDCYNAFIDMANAAKKDKVTLVLTSGYRTLEQQKNVYNDYLNSRGQIYADGFAARPGASEHQTGLALDVFEPGATTDMFHTTKSYEWLSEHAHEYGFILRYPEGKEYLTGYKPESWHYRYVGVDMAKKIKDEGITFDEYYAYYLANE